MTDHLRVSREGQTLVLTLNRPEKRNAITHEMVGAWTDALVRAREDSDIRVVVVTGEGDAFCSGADFSLIRARTSGENAISRSYGSQELELFLHRVAVAMEDLDKPVIAAVNGPAVGAGLGMALMADLRFLSDRARVSEGYINAGVFPGDCDTFYLPRIVGTSRALMMMWTGDFIDANECLAVGLANLVFPHEELMSETMAFAERLAARPHMIVRAIKRATYACVSMNLRDSLGMINAYSKLTRKSQERV